jgi:hypothetical protein
LDLVNAAQFHDVNGKFCGKHDIQKMDVERQVFPNSDIPGEIPE